MESLHRISDVIETVAREGSIGIRELSALLGFLPATTHRITSTLVERCYLKQDPEQVPMAMAAAPPGAPSTWRAPPRLPRMRAGDLTL